MSRIKLYAIVIAGMNAALSSLALLAIDNYELVSVLAIVSLSLFSIVCVTESDNILFLARTFILGFIGYFPILVKILYGQDALFSGYEQSTQGFDIAAIMYVTTSFALLSSQIGFVAARYKRQPNGSLIEVPMRPLSIGSAEIPITYWYVAAMVGILLAAVSAYFFVMAYGPSILVAGYGASERLGGGLPFGTVGVLGAIGIFSLFIAGLKGHLRRWKLMFLLFSGVYIIYSQLLMGLRQDAMSVLFGLLVLYGVAKRREIGLKLAYFPLIVIGYIFFEAWGVARTALAAGIPLMDIVWSTFVGMRDSEVVRLGTVSPIATTFSNTVFLIENQTITFSLGKSYIEWLLRIPPEVVYPARPVDYALMFEEHGLSAGGGFFELAEVYMNFGVAGGLVIPGLVSFLMGRAYYYAMNQQTMLSYFLLFSFLTIFFRATWYQTFAFFKAFLVCMLAYLIYVFIVQVARAIFRDEQLRERHDAT